MRITNILCFTFALAMEAANVDENSITYPQLVKNSVSFEQNRLAGNFLRGSFPIQTNQVQHIVKKSGYSSSVMSKIEEHANHTVILAHSKVIKLARKFLECKKVEGTAVERGYYKNMDLDTFIDSLFLKRALTFIGREDDTTLCLYNGAYHFKKALPKIELVGTEFETYPFTLDTVMSYDEMEIAALIGLSSPTNFINTGTRDNLGKEGYPGTFEQEGVYIGMVGALFEQPSHMEHKFFAVNDLNRFSGPNIEENVLNFAWAEFYGCAATGFPTLAHARENPAEYISMRKHWGTTYHLHRAMFYIRMQVVTEPVLLHADAEALRLDKQAIVHLVGLGMGVWAINELEQWAVLKNVIVDAVRGNSLPRIDVIEVAYYRGQPFDQTVLDVDHHAIQIKSTMNAPAEKRASDNQIVVATYAWDSNAYPGNEYYYGALGASGDPAAACCSTITQLQNPYINTSVRAASKLRVYGQE